MQYKTIVLEMLQQHPQIHQQLASRRALLPSVELYANRLKTGHEAWKGRLSQALPESHSSQIASEALEIAIWELESTLESDFATADSEPISFEGAMEFIAGHRARA